MYMYMYEHYKVKLTVSGFLNFTTVCPLLSNAVLDTGKECVGVCVCVCVCVCVHIPKGRVLTNKQSGS